MSSSEWDEVLALQKDFARTQLSSTVHRLAERNVIEVVSKLIQMGLLEVIYTIDGREYLTPNQLDKEIRDELFLHGGRINLVDLHQIANVDLKHIEARVADLIRRDRHVSIVQGQLIDRDYLDRISEEINEMLQEAGQISIADLSKTFNLPAEILLDNIERRLGLVIHGQLDALRRDVLYTEAFLARQKARIRGVFSAITKPTSIASLIAQYGFQDQLFYSVADDLVASGRLAGSMQGRMEKAVFVPEIYAKTQSNWIVSFFKQNDYIEYDTLRRLGVGEPKPYCKRRLDGNDERLVFLPTCCIGKSTQDQVEASIDGALASESWIDILPLLPSPCSVGDVAEFVQQILAQKRSVASIHVFCDGGVVVSEQFVQKCTKLFDDIIAQKAEKAAAASVSSFHKAGGGDGKAAAAALTRESGEKALTKKEQRKQKMALGPSSATQGGKGGFSREKRVPKSKDRKRGGGDDGGGGGEGDDNVVRSGTTSSRKGIEFLSDDEIAEILTSNFDDCPEGLIRDLSEYLSRPLSKKLEEAVRSAFVTASVTRDEKGSAHKRKHGEYEEKMNGLYTNARLFNKGIDFFSGDARVQLSKHLLRTLCTDMANICLAALAEEHLMSSMEPQSFSVEDRARILLKLPSPVKSAMVGLHNSLNKQSTSDFFDALETACSSKICQFLLKKVDRKKERQLVFTHRQTLLDQLRGEQEPAMALHLTAVVLFIRHTHALIHCPGRCVPFVIGFLEVKLSPVDYRVMSDYQTLVMKLFGQKDNDAQGTGDDEKLEEGKSVSETLSDLLESLKKLATSAGKETSET